MAPLRICVAALALGACGDNKVEMWPYYRWGESPSVMGAFTIDDSAPDDPVLLGKIDEAAHADYTVMLYGHLSSVGASVETIDALLARAEAQGVHALSFAELGQGPPRRSICLSFDDTEVDAWYDLLPVLAQHDAHVSFFVTRYSQFTDEQRAKLHEIYAAHNSIEAHGVNHAYANEYIPQFGLDAYLEDEVLPSIEILRADVVAGHLLLPPRPPGGEGIGRAHV